MALSTAMTFVSQLTAFAASNLSLTATVVAIVGVAVIEREAVLGWVGVRAPVPSVSAPGASSVASGAFSLLRMAWGLLTWVARAGARAIGHVLSLGRSVGLRRPAFSRPSLPGGWAIPRPNLGGLLGRLVGLPRWLLSGLWGGLRGVGGLGRGILPGATRGASSATTAGLMRLTTLPVGAIVEWGGIVIVGFGLGWTLAPVLPIQVIP